MVTGNYSNTEKMQIQPHLKCSLTIGGAQCKYFLFKLKQPAWKRANLGLHTYGLHFYSELPSVTTVVKLRQDVASLPVVQGEVKEAQCTPVSRMVFKKYHAKAVGTAGPVPETRSTQPGERRSARG